jgi:hypothetical protein
MLAGRHEELAAVLAFRPDALERLHLLEQANSTWNELARGNPGKPSNRLYLMRSWCRLSDAELAMNNLQAAREHADASLPFFHEFKVTSPSLVVLRDIGFCYESLGNAQHAVAVDRSLSPTGRRAAETEARQWYRKSAEVWNEWVTRGAATPESEVERHKIEHLLRAQ